MDINQVRSVPDQGNGMSQGPGNRRAEDDSAAEAEQGCGKGGCWKGKQGQARVGPQDSGKDFGLYPESPGKPQMSLKQE